MSAKLQNAMSTTNIYARSTVLLLFLCSLAATAGAREIYRQNFEELPASAQAGSADGPEGKGWRQADPALSLSAPASFQGVRRGVASFDLRRISTFNPEKPAIIFEFIDAQRSRAFRVMTAWNQETAPGRTAFYFLGGGSDYMQNSLGLWSPMVLLDHEVQAGQTIHVDIAWDDTDKKYGLFVDGKPVEAQPGSYDAAQQAFTTDSRQLINEANLERGEPAMFFEKPFGYFLDRVEQIVIGRDSERPLPQRRQAAPLANAVVDNFVVVVDEPFEKLHDPAHDVKNLSGTYTGEGIMLSWEPPEIHGINQQYVVYRRAGNEGNARFEKLSPEPVRDLQFLDAGAAQGETYRYSVTSVYGDMKGGLIESQYPPEISVSAARFAISSVAADKPIYAAGGKITVTLRGTPDKTASYTIDGIVSDQPMTEVDDGVYVGKTTALEGLNMENAALSATLADQTSAVSAIGPPITIDAISPEGVPAIIAASPWPGEIEVSFDASPSKDVDHYLIFRGVDSEPDIDTNLGAAAYDSVKELKFSDFGVVAGLEYSYIVAPVDKAGNIGLPSESVSAISPLGDGPAISGITFEPSGKPARPGDVVEITVAGQGDAQVSVDLGGLALGLELTEQGRTGKYVGTYTVKNEDVGPTKSLYVIIAHMTDDYGSSALAGPSLEIIGEDSLNDDVPPAISEVTHDAFQVAGFSGKLVPGNILTAVLKGEPGCSAVFGIAAVVEGVPMEEVEPGVYKGSYEVEWDDEGEEAELTATLTDDGGNGSSAAAKSPVSFDTRVRLLVTSQKSELPADRKSTAQLSVRAEDANGDGISGHEISLTLSTTEEYTGVVGGGKLEDRTASADDEDDLEIKWGGKTDAFGEVKAVYTAGYAAKTALIIAKDLTSGDIGAGWLSAYIAATTTIELFPRTQKDMPDKAVIAIFAEPSKLTADGRSKSRITAVLRDLDGRPMAGEEVVFTLAGNNGRLRELRGGRTDEKGRAEAEYRAGKAMGAVTITASCAELGVTANVLIVLMSDAPAKISIASSAFKLPADGQSEAELSVLVTDINDNPNSQAPVALSLLEGQGSLAAKKLLTDRNGEGGTVFTAGNKTGLVVLEARYASRLPTEEELRRVYGAVFVPRLEDSQERDRVKIEEWLIKTGDEVEKGQPLATLKSRKGEWTLISRGKGVFARSLRREKDLVELGDIIGYVELDGDFWSQEYGD